MLKSIFLGICFLLLLGSVTGCFLLIKPAIKVTKTALLVTGKVVNVATAPLR